MRRDWQLWRAAHALGLTYQQTEIAALLAERGDNFVSEHDLAKSLGPGTLVGRTDEGNLVRVLVYRLRKQFGVHAVESARGLGYRLAPPVCVHVKSVLESYREAA